MCTSQRQTALFKAQPNFNIENDTGATSTSDGAYKEPQHHISVAPPPIEWREPQQTRPVGQKTACSNQVPLIDEVPQKALMLRIAFATLKAD